MFQVTDLMGKTPHETIVNDVKGVRDAVAGITSAGKAGDAIVGVVGYPGCSTVTDYLVTEVCPYCESEIEMRWNVREQGYKAICPVCGNRLMLCDECRHRGSDGEYIPGGCDYDIRTETCHFNQAGRGNGTDKYASANRKAEFSYILEFAGAAEFDGIHGILMRQLRALWSAYCLRHSLDVDTRQYNDDLTMLWEVVKGNPGSEYMSEQSDNFEHYMRQDIS